MLSAVKFIPREEVIIDDNDEKESCRGLSKKRKHKDRDKAQRKSKNKERRRKRARSSDSEGTENSSSSASERESDRELEVSARDVNKEAKTRRKEAGLDWMLSAPDRPFGASAPSKAVEDNHTVDSEKPKSYLRELNPDLAGGVEESRKQSTQKSTVPMVGDGGVSWRLKALKRAQERAARDGLALDEVVEDRWGSLGNLTSSVAVKRSAHANAHLHAIRDRRSRQGEDSAEGGATGSKETERRTTKDSAADLRGGDHGRYGSKMRVPRPDTNLSWRSSKKFESQSLRDTDAAIVRAAAKTFNKYSGDGSFLKSFASTQVELKRDTEVDKQSAETGAQASTDSVDVVYEPTRVFQAQLEEKLRESSADAEEAPQARPESVHQKIAEGGSSEGLSANQVAAKAMRLRLQGKTKEADELRKDFEACPKDRPPPRSDSQGFAAEREQNERPSQRTGQGLNISSMRAKDKLHARNQSYDRDMAGTIARNTSYKGNVDDEYEEFGNGMEKELVYERKGDKKKLGEKGRKESWRGDFSRHITTQQERCQFCFENPKKPKHLVIAIANFVYLMIPPSPSIVPFHCCIVPMVHEGATRNVDESVWEELRNFKKCLVQMFGNHGKKVLFLETAMGLSRQRRHCYIDCIPVPSDAAEDAPLYFKKAIDEVEDEWSQHDAKKLIDTRQKGLRNSIPKNFPYFHVEFGMKGGYCHVIDDESSFKPQFGRDVIAGILELPTEGHQRRNSEEEQRMKVKEFLKMWEPFDWTKMLD